MYALGIDPSTKSTGWAVMNHEEKIIGHGVITGLADDPASFYTLETALIDIIEKYKVSHIRCETQFIGANRQTAIKLIRPTGVILSVAGRYDLPFDFSEPSSWRKTIHGKGKWSKRDTYNFINESYGDVIEFKSFNKDNDKTDAIGVTWSLIKDLKDDEVEETG